MSRAVYGGSLGARKRTYLTVSPHKKIVPTMPLLFYV